MISRTVAVLLLQFLSNGDAEVFGGARFQKGQPVCEGLLLYKVNRNVSVEDFGAKVYLGTESQSEFECALMCHKLLFCRAAVYDPANATCQFSYRQQLCTDNADVLLDGPTFLTGGIRVVQCISCRTAIFQTSNHEASPSTTAPPLTISLTTTASRTLATVPVSLTVTNLSSVDVDAKKNMSMEVGRRDIQKSWSLFRVSPGVVSVPVPLNETDSPSWGSVRRRIQPATVASSLTPSNTSFSISAIMRTTTSPTTLTRFTDVTATTVSVTDAFPHTIEFSIPHLKFNETAMAGFHEVATVGDVPAPTSRKFQRIKQPRAHCTEHLLMPCAFGVGRDCGVVTKSDGCLVCVCPLKSPAQGCLGALYMTADQRVDLLLGKASCENGQKPQTVTRYFRKMDVKWENDDCVPIQHPYCGYDVQKYLPRTKDECYEHCFSTAELEVRQLHRRR